MRSGYQMRQWQAAERRDDHPCPKCADRMGNHRGLPGVCSVEGCDCIVTWAEIEEWRKAGMRL